VKTLAPLLCVSVAVAVGCASHPSPAPAAPTPVAPASAALTPAVPASTIAPPAAPSSTIAAPPPPAASSPTVAAPAPARLAYLRVHMDHAPVASVAAAEAARRQQVSWIATHGAAVGELPTYWLRVGADRMWAARPAASWEDLKAQGAKLGALDDAIRAAVGPAFDANEERVHQAIDEHHNELWRPVANLTLAPSSGPSTAERALAVTELSEIASLRLVAIEKPLPARQSAYLAAVDKINTALRAAEPSLWRSVYVSSLGSGAYVHLLGAARPLSPAQLQQVTRSALTRSLGAAEAARLLRELAASLHHRELHPASLAPDLSTLPPSR
jgi:hypothetical protein